MGGRARDHSFVCSRYEGSIIPYPVSRPGKKVTFITAKPLPKCATYIAFSELASTQRVESVATTRPLYIRFDRATDYVRKSLRRSNASKDHLRRILDNFISAAVSYIVVQSFANGGISQILDDEGMIHCQITEHTMPCITGRSLVIGVSGDVSEEAEEEEDPNIRGLNSTLFAACSSFKRS
jgi:hypothetical protein